MFASFLKETLRDDNIQISDPKDPGKFKTISVEELLRKGDVDTSLLQLWLTSMANNPDTLLQVFDKVVKVAKDKKRIKVIQKV